MELPPAETPLNRHSLFALENWLNQLGAKRSAGDPCLWIWSLPKWTAKIQMAQDDLMVTWEKDGKKKQCFFSYRLSRIDVEQAISQGP